MKHSLQLKLSQHLALTPQLQQSIRLLQLSTVEMSQEIERVLQENPMLERADAATEESFQPPPGAGTEHSAPEQAPAESTEEFSAAETETSWPEEDLSNFGGRDESGFGGRDEDDDSDYAQSAAEKPTLREHLNWQLSLTQLSERDRRIVTLLVDSLDEDGYLTQELDELAAMLPEELAIEPVELQIALNHLQNLDPPGIGARNLAECLALQLDVLPKDTPYLAESLCTVQQHLEVLAVRDFAKLKKLLGCDDAGLRAVQSLITHLNPRPGENFAQSEARYIIPDVIVRKIKGAWMAALNPDAVPKLRINRMYADILQRSREANHQQLAGQLQEARWLIKNVQQRFDTILRVAQAIVDRQRHFFEHGEVAMRPLVLREIAGAVGLHESTVSRVTTQKFMLTPRGIFELKYFFGSHVTTEAGGACSATAIRALIKQLVGAEDAHNPLSDSQISEVLGKQGIVVARRTIAKYREALQILPVNMRKTI